MTDFRNAGRGVRMRGWELLVGYWLPGVLLGWGLGAIAVLLLHWRLP